MKKELLTVLSIFSFILSQGFVVAQPNYSVQMPNNTYQQYSLPNNSYQNQGYSDSSSLLKGKVVMVPINTVITAASGTTISSETANIGDSVTLYLSSDFYYGNTLIAPVGSKINGTVLQVKKGGMASQNGSIQIKFTNIVTPFGQMIPMSAKIQTNDGTGILKAGTTKDVTKEYVKDVGIGAAAGAALGTAMGALSSGSVGKGAIYGTALGGGLGLGKSLIDKGGNVEIPQGSQLNIVLDQPITVSSNNPY